MNTAPTQKPVRSPSYPNLSLPSAISAVAKIESKYRASPVDRGDAAKLLGYSSLSGPANKTLASLSTYGLVESSGKGEMKVTPLAKAILHPKDKDERNAALRAAAFTPNLFNELQERFKDISPPEEGVETFLNRQGFNQNAVRPAAKAYLNTLSYLEEAGASKSNSTQSSNAAESSLTGEATGRYGGAQVGDLVQWESNGALQFEKPERVRMVSEDGLWVAIEGSETGVPMNEVIVEQAAPSKPPTFPIKEVEISATKGEAEWIRNKLGPETNVRVLVTGEMGPKEIGRFIKILEAQKAVLEEDWLS